MGLCIRFLTAAALVAGMGIASAADAQHRHGGENNYHHGGGNYHRGGGGNAAGAAIIGGIIGLGVGAAIASHGYYAPAAASLLWVAASLLLRTATACLLRLLSGLPTGVRLPAHASTKPLQIADTPNRGTISMKTIRSSHFAYAAIIALLALPAAALAQPTQSPAPATPPAAASSPMTSQRALGKSMEERVENHIKQLHAQLQITPAEQPQWDQFAQVMRENARDMDQAFMQRAQQYPTMNAMQNMQSYEKMAEAHVQHLQKLVPAFDNLYNAMPEQQKKLTDQVFRANAERHTAQSRHGTNATAK